MHPISFPSSGIKIEQGNDQFEMQLHKKRIYALKCKSQ